MTLPAIMFGNHARWLSSRPRTSKLSKGRAFILSSALRKGQLCLCPSCCEAFPERAILRAAEVRDVGRRFRGLRGERGI